MVLNPKRPKDSHYSRKSMDYAQTCDYRRVTRGFHSKDRVRAKNNSE